LVTRAKDPTPIYLSTLYSSWKSVIKTKRRSVSFHWK